jgi:enoyl-CoA hydratase
MASYENLLVAHDKGISILTIHRPAKLNALNQALIDELADAIAMTLHPDSDTRAVILTGSGDKAFVAGADIAEMSEMSVVDAKAFSDSGHHLCALIEQAHCPVIAAVNGFALGGGLELALACDFIYASERAKFGQPEVTLGLMPGFGGTQRLPRRIGAGLARELIYSGETIHAERALAVGLVNAVFPANELLARATAVATTIAAKGPVGVAASKRVILRGLEADLVTGCELEAQAFSSLFGTEDQREGTLAFLEKRPPKFVGR